jgi:hypothetical protein
MPAMSCPQSVRAARAIQPHRNNRKKLAMSSGRFGGKRIPVMFRNETKSRINQII